MKRRGFLGLLGLGALAAGPAAAARLWRTPPPPFADLLGVAAVDRRRAEYVQLIGFNGLASFPRASEMADA